MCVCETERQKREEGKEGGSQRNALILVGELLTLYCSFHSSSFYWICTLCRLGFGSENLFFLPFASLPCIEELSLPMQWGLSRASPRPAVITFPAAGVRSSPTLTSWIPLSPRPNNWSPGSLQNPNRANQSHLSGHV